MLKFIGIGDAFSYHLGNCSAYYKKDNRLILIDCGENIFERIIKSDILDGVSKVDIIITHFHSDHVGSLGTLLFYLDMKEIYDKTIIYPNTKNMNELLRLYGVEECDYKVLSPSCITDYEVREIKQKHSNTEAYGYLMNLENKSIYYSGDTKVLRSEVLDKLLSDKIDYFYQDIRLDKNDYHITMEELNELVPYDLRHKINCMHLSDRVNHSIFELNGYSLVKKR